MKKTLLLQTALVAAAGLFVADVANAQVKAEPLGVTVGGYYSQMFQYQDRDPNNGSKDHRFATDSEIWFNVRGVLDNGVVVGARIELESATYGDQIDERYMWLERSDLGRVEIGSTDSVTTKMIYMAPSVLPNYSTTVHSEYSAVVNAPLMRFVNAQDDAERINIYTASNRYFGSKAGKGLQLGFSYTPNNCQDFQSATDPNSTTGAPFTYTCSGGFIAPVNSEEGINIAANYLESFGNVDAALYAGYNSVKVVGNDRESGWQVGAQFAINVGGGAAVQIGGGYNKEDITNVREREAYTAGIRYLTNGSAPGSVGIGVEGAWREDDAANVGDLDYYQLGLTYQLATGVLTFAGIGVAETDAPGTANDVDQTFAVLGISLTF